MDLRSYVLDHFYKRCPITNVSHKESDVAHIIPRHVCTSLGLPYSNDPKNCVLLSGNIHTRFDQYDWSFDPFSANLDDLKNKSKYVKLNIVVGADITRDPSSSHIGAYINSSIKVLRESLPYFYVHYNIFLVKNYRSCTLTLLEMYRYFIHEEGVFSEMLQDGYNCCKKLRSLRPRYRCIVGSKFVDSEPQYLVLWHGYSFIEATWEPESNIDKEGISDFEELESLKEDPAFM